MAASAGMAPYARAGGLATAFLPAGGGRQVPLFVGAGLVAAVALAVGDDPAAPLGVAGAVVGAAGAHWLAVRRLGGFTGDTLGALGVVAETVGLYAALAVG
jgi:adenosylcobinamide-GDP ribazoletransferase